MTRPTSPLVQGYRAGLDALRTARIGQNGLRERSVILCGHPRSHAPCRWLAHQVEDFLIGFETLGH